MCVLNCFSHVQLFRTWWTLLPMEFSRQEYWSVWPCPPPWSLPNPRIETISLMSPVLAGRFFIPTPPGKPSHRCRYSN